MGISNEVAQAIQQHISLELEAQNKYLAFALVANRQGYFGCEKFFKAESANERDHLEKFLVFINDFDFPATAVPAVVAFSIQRTPVVEMFAAALEMEQSVTASISNLVSISRQQNDELSFEFLQEFIEEQRNSEIEYRDILNRYDMSAGNMPAFDDYVGGLA